MENITLPGYGGMQANIYGNYAPTSKPRTMPTDLVDPNTGQLLRLPVDDEEARQANFLLDQFESKQAAPMQQQLNSTLMQAIQSPGLSDKAVEGIINKGTEEISESERSNTGALMNALAASGGGAGGADELGMRAMQSQYSGQRANLARDVRLDAERDRSQQRLQAAGLLQNALQSSYKRPRVSAPAGGGAGGMGQAKGTGWSVSGGGSGISGQMMNEQRQKDAASGKFKYRPGSNIPIPA